MLPRARIVRVTTKEALDATLLLGTADQVIVEGDEQLLSYAIAKASGDPQNRSLVEFEEDGEQQVEKMPMGQTLTTELHGAEPTKADHADVLLPGCTLCGKYKVGGLLARGD